MALVIMIVLVPNDSLLRESSFMGVQICAFFSTCGSMGTVKWTWVGQMADLLCFHGHYLVVDSLVAFGM